MDFPQEISKFKVSLDDFQKIKSIGYGSYGEVFLAKYIPNNNEVALKIFSDKILEGKSKACFCKEIKVMSLCNNPFIVKFLGYTDNYPYSIAMELAKYGSLYDSLRHKPGSHKIDSTQKTIIALSISYGMCELHRRHIIHNDLKSMNILLDENLFPKICDFGISRFLGENEEIATNIIGTPHWMAPEMFETDDYTEKVDVYAFGILLWEILTEEIPFENMTSFQVMTAVCIQKKRPEIPSNTSQGLSQLISSCWEHNPDKRPTFQEIYQMFLTKKAFFNGINFKKFEALVKYIQKFDNNFGMAEEEAK
ncbi:TKL family protein kinase [Histomonas meleagridis]|uniref:TKL family protein kinase n=1 Tax=Histomonas meleagridis TaxID=135588 RepID=UPI00355A88F9|nr:TKL family protein kinase [Histomonas meleagridis]KAH0805830.1 TKL family protein kinase [Histomonas meleagridis]